MKVILTGGSGFVGGALLRHVIRDDRIDHVFALVRKELPTELAASPKVTVIKHDDFGSYPDELLEQLIGAEGCLWAIGGRAPQFPDLDTAKRVQVAYPIAALTAFAKKLAPPLQKDGKKFRFVFVSGKFAEWDQERSLMFLSDTRKLKGAAEKGICEIADANKDSVEVYIGRPSGILAEGTASLQQSVGRVLTFVAIDRLASAFTNLLLNGNEETILEWDELDRIG